MSLPKGYLPREGDILIVHAKVQFDVERGDDSVHLKVDYKSFSMDLADVIGVARRNFKVGERVEDLGHRVMGPMTIVAIEGELAWSKRDGDGQMFTSPLSTLELIPDDPEPASDILPAPEAPDDDEIKF